MDEIAGIISDHGSANIKVDHDIIVHLQGSGLYCISNLYPPYLPLHYVLLFPKGQDGWHLDIPLQQ